MLAFPSFYLLSISLSLSLSLSSSLQYGRNMQQMKALLNAYNKTGFTFISFTHTLPYTQRLLHKHQTIFRMKYSLHKHSKWRQQQRLWFFWRSLAPNSKTFRSIDFLLFVSPQNTSHGLYNLLYCFFVIILLFVQFC